MSRSVLDILKQAAESPPADSEAPSPIPEPSTNGHREQPRPADGKPRVTVSTQEHEVNAEAVAALARDPDVYQRGGVLVHVIRDARAGKKGITRPVAPRIADIAIALLRERLAANAQFISLHETKNGVVERGAHPPPWCVAAVHARADWQGIRHLEAVVDYPVLRPDGTILSRPGYDPDTGLLFDSAATFPPIPNRPTLDDAVAARDTIMEVVTDFPFELDIHRAAWFAGLLTPLARFAFAGPSPLFLVDSNVRGSGKGLSLDCISRIVTGDRFTVATYTHKEEELRKRITAIALAGDRLVLFDNLDGNFGNAVLDAALTATAWEDRLLGQNRMVRAPLYATFFATGNNVAVAADTARRICHVRLESPEERPEERQGFQHPDLLAWVSANRPSLLAAALTILRAYCAIGRPDQKLPAWGSFEGWSALVRSAVVWVGLPDPAETRLLLQEHADVAAESMAGLLAGLEHIDPKRQGVTAAEIVQRLHDAATGEHADLRDAVEGLIGKLDARLLGNKLRTYRRRIFRGRFIDQAGTYRRSARWAVFAASEFSRSQQRERQEFGPYAEGF